MEVLVFANPMDVLIDRFIEKITKVPALSLKFVLEHDRFKSLVRQKTLDRRVIVFFAYDLLPIESIISGVGPINFKLQEEQISAK